MYAFDLRSKCCEFLNLLFDVVDGAYLNRFQRSREFLFFFFNDTATTEIYTLSLHDALPIYAKLATLFGLIAASSAASIVWAFISPTAASEISSIDYFNLMWAGIAMLIAFIAFLVRSEEHTSELQSQFHLVCRLLLEKKKMTK